MTSARRAPELSAILSIDSCCTTVPPSAALPLRQHGPAARALAADGPQLQRVLDRLGGPPEPQAEPFLREHRELLLQLLALHLPQRFRFLARHPSAPPVSRTST